jgi:hypothetical protein
VSQFTLLASTATPVPSLSAPALAVLLGLAAVRLIALQHARGTRASYGRR